MGQSQSSWLFWIQKQPWKLKASFTRPDSFSGKSATASNCSLMAWNIYTGPYATYCPCWSIHGAYMGYSFCSTPIGFYHKSPPQPGWSFRPTVGEGQSMIWPMDPPDVQGKWKKTFFLHVIWSPKPKSFLKLFAVRLFLDRCCCCFLFFFRNIHFKHLCARPSAAAFRRKGTNLAMELGYHCWGQGNFSHIHIFEILISS